MTNPNSGLQKLDITNLVRRLAELRGNPLEITTHDEAATSATRTAPEQAVINGQGVSYDVMHHPTRALATLLRHWSQPITVNNITWHPDTADHRDADQLVIHRQRLPLAKQGEHPPPQTIGNPAPTIHALGVEFGVPITPGQPDWRQRYLAAPDPETQQPHFALNIWATVTPRITLSDTAALESQMLAHDDIPYLIPGPLAHHEAEIQIDQALETAASQLAQLTGAPDFRPVATSREAPGHHPAYTCDEPVSFNLRGDAKATKIASIGCQDVVDTSFARALYLNPQAKLVPVQGHYGTGATVTAIPKMIRTVQRDGTTRDLQLPGEPQPPYPQPPRQIQNPQKVPNIRMLVEIQPINDDPDAQVEQHWLEADLVVHTSGSNLIVTLSDLFDGDVDDLTNLLVHMSRPYNQDHQTNHWEQTMTSAVAAHQAMGDEDAAFRTELKIMARRLLEEQRSNPTANSFTVETSQGMLTWTKR